MKPLTQKEIETIKTLNDLGLKAKQISEIIGRGKSTCNAVISGKRDETNEKKRIDEANKRAKQKQEKDMLCVTPPPKGFWKKPQILLCIKTYF